MRGGTVMFEPGAVGGNFVGCMFLTLEDTVEVRVQTQHEQAKWDEAP